MWHTHPVEMQHFSINPKKGEWDRVKWCCRKGHVGESVSGSWSCYRNMERTTYRSRMSQNSRWCSKESRCILKAPPQLRWQLMNTVTSQRWAQLSGSCTLTSARLRRPKALSYLFSKPSRLLERGLWKSSSFLLSKIYVPPLFKSRVSQDHLLPSWMQCLTGTKLLYNSCFQFFWVLLLQQIHIYGLSYVSTGKTLCQPPALSHMEPIYIISIFCLNEKVFNGPRKRWPGVRENFIKSEFYNKILLGISIIILKIIILCPFSDLKYSTFFKLQGEATRVVAHACCLNTQEAKAEGLL